MPGLTRANSLKWDWHKICDPLWDYLYHPSRFGFREIDRRPLAIFAANRVSLKNGIGHEYKIPND